MVSLLHRATINEIKSTSPGRTFTTRSLKNIALVPEMGNFCTVCIDDLGLNSAYEVQRIDPTVNLPFQFQFLNRFIFRPILYFTSLLGRIAVLRT